MVSHTKVAQAFIEKKKATGSRMFTDGETIYSHGHHWTIAKHLKNNVVMFNTSNYSSSTNSHTRHVRNALSGTEYKVVDVSNQEMRNWEWNTEGPIILYREKEPSDMREVVTMIQKIMEKNDMKRVRMLKSFKQAEEAITTIHTLIIANKL